MLDGLESLSSEATGLALDLSPLPRTRVARSSPQISPAVTAGCRHRANPAAHTSGHWASGHRLSGLAASSREPIEYDFHSPACRSDSV